MRRTMTRRVLPFLGLAALLASCAGPQVQPLMPTPILFSELGIGPLDHVPEAQRWNPRRVYYATTRARKSDLQRIEYGNEEGDAISLGMALIGFGGPQLSWADLNEYSRRAERPEGIDLSIAGLVEVGHYRPAGEAGPVQDVGGAAAWWLADLNASIGAARDRDLLVYVHGAKVNFYNANAFAAQLDHFMGRDMTSVAFAWPTRQNIVAYGSGGDVRRASRAAPALASLLERLARESDARRIHVVCWSAGGRVVVEALRQLHARAAEEGGSLQDRYRLGTIYFAAADVPGEAFLEALPALDALAKRVVVTISSGDAALEMARLVMRGGTRLGQRNEDLLPGERAVVLAAERLEVIDVSRGAESRGFDITGHRYWFDHPWASTDVILAVRSDLEPDERALEATELALLWGIPADYPQRLRARLGRSDLEIRRAD